MWLCECVSRPVARHNRESSIPLEAARLLLNLAIINTDTMQVAATATQTVQWKVSVAAASLHSLTYV